MRPHLLVTDISLPDLSGLDLAEMVRDKYREVRTIILTAELVPDEVRRALAVGVSAYLLKDSAVAELEIAIRAALAGECYLTPRASRVLIRGDREVSSASVFSSLTPRQRQVLRLIAQGRTNKEIASLLGITAKTVEKHRGDLMRSVGVHNTAGLVRYAVKNKIVEG